MFVCHRVCVCVLAHREADTDGDGRLSLNEFVTWLATGNSGLAMLAPGADPTRSTVFHTAARPPIGFTIAEIRRMTQIHRYYAQDVLERFLTCVASSGGWRRSCSVYPPPPPHPCTHFALTTVIRRSVRWHCLRQRC